MTLSTAVDPSRVARATAIKTTFKDLRGGRIVLLPQRIAIIGQGSSNSVYATTKRQVTSAVEVAGLYGFGSPLHLAALQVFPINGDGVGTIPVTVYPLDDAGAATAAAGDITPTVAQTVAAEYLVRVNNIDSEAFTIPASGATVASVVAQITAAINANLDMPVIAADNASTDVTITSKWKGASANDLVIELVGSATAGTTFAITQPVGGATNPDVSAALAQVGNVWETMFLSCLDIADTVTLDLYAAFGEGRWGALTRKPCLFFTGNTIASITSAISVCDARGTDRTNVQLVAPGSDNLPFVVAARQLARIAVVANSNPPHDYGSQDASGITPGTDGEQWTDAQRDQAVKAGSSTAEVKDSVLNISDVVTFYHPTGDPAPAYRFVVDNVRLWNVLHNLDIIFDVPDWDGAPLIPDDQPTSNRSAKRPKTAVAAVASMLDSLGLEAIISDPATAKANTFAEIDSQNPKRLNLTTTIQLSGNTNIKSIDLNFGFFFGTQTVLA